jgi:hypothetical protein
MSLLDLTKFDTRIIRRNLKTGLVTNQDYQNHLSKLEDCSNSYELIDLEDKVASEEEMPKASDFTN